MSGHAYPAVPTTAIGWSARESKDSIDQYTIEVPIQAYRPNTRTSSYERDKELGIVRVHEVARTPSPTPSEAQVLAPKTKFMDGVRRILDRRRNLDWRRYANPRVMGARYPCTMSSEIVLTRLSMCSDFRPSRLRQYALHPLPSVPDEDNHLAAAVRELDA